MSNFSILENAVSGPLVATFGLPTLVLIFLGFFFFLMLFARLEFGGLLVLMFAALSVLSIVGFGALIGNYLFVVFIIIALLAVIAFQVYR